jgi:hypothetical protein
MSETKKNRPTPKRTDATKKRQALAPVVGKEAKKASRDAARAARIASREAFMRGDENALPARDKGPARRFVRDFVDARRSIGEFFLPVMIIVLALVWVSSINPPKDPKQVPITTTISILLMWGVLLIAVIDGFLLSRKIKRAVSAKFPDSSTKGLGMYGFIRSTQMRRMRAPKPQVKAGTKL